MKILQIFSNVSQQREAKIGHVTPRSTGVRPPFTRCSPNQAQKRLEWQDYLAP